MSSTRLRERLETPLGLAAICNKFFLVCLGSYHSGIQDKTSFDMASDAGAPPSVYKKPFPLAFLHQVIFWNKRDVIWMRKGMYWLAIIKLNGDTPLLAFQHSWVGCVSYARILWFSEHEILLAIKTSVRLKTWTSFLFWGDDCEMRGRFLPAPIFGFKIIQAE